MKTFTSMAAQGDILIFKVDALPDNVKPASGENGKYIVAHSETGHHHSIPISPAVQMFLSPDPNVMFLKVDEPVSLLHERSWDTHETLTFPKGIFQVNRQRELAPEGWRTVMD